MGLAVARSRGILLGSAVAMVAVRAEGSVGSLADLGVAQRLAIPGFAHARNNWGIALARQGRWPEAAQHYEDARRLSPDYPEAHLNIAAALQRLGRHADGERHVDRARSTLLPPGR